MPPVSISNLSCPDLHPWSSLLTAPPGSLPLAVTEMGQQEVWAENRRVEERGGFPSLLTPCFCTLPAHPVTHSPGSISPWAWIHHEPLPPTCMPSVLRIVTAPAGSDLGYHHPICFHHLTIRSAGGLFIEVSTLKLLAMKSVWWVTLKDSGLLVTHGWKVHRSRSLDQWVKPE